MKPSLYSECNINGCAKRMSKIYWHGSDKDVLILQDCVLVGDCVEHDASHAQNNQFPGQNHQSVVLL